MGMNFFPTKIRDWLNFCERKHETLNGQESEYYYRMTVCNLLNTQIDLPLDAEPVLPGENEVASAKRMIERLCDNYTSLFDVVVADALYMEGPFVNFCLGRNKDVIIVLKKNYPSLLEDAQSLIEGMRPLSWDEGERTIQAWDIEGFVTDTIDVPLRVLHTKETYIKKVIKAGQIVEELITADWWWATTVSSRRLGTRDLWKIAHSRWQIENEIFNTLGQHWFLNHCYKHDPVAIVNFTLVLFIAFMLVQCFYKRNLKPEMRQIINSLIGLANQLYATLTQVTCNDLTMHSGAGPP